jgi:hypothetical protein
VVKDGRNVKLTTRLSKPEIAEDLSPNPKHVFIAKGNFSLSLVSFEN